ncbi:MAG: sugar phosphate isomerase/epimerase family protein [Candidatus Korarchaeota archaeon]|nr:sugar phosphate isomerase/epimerase [Thermoproteota archaeon]
MSLSFVFKYGVSTSILNPRYENIVDVLEFAAKHKFEHVEIIADGLQHVAYISDDHISAIQDLAQKNKITLSVHAPYYSIDLANLSNSIRKFAIDEIINGLHLAQLLSAEWLTIHLGFKFYPTKVLWKKAFENLCDSLKQILTLARDVGIIIGMELRSGFFDLGHPTLLEKILNHFNNDEFLAVVIDTAQLAGFPRLPMRDVISRFKEKIVSFHIRDVNPQIGKDMLACGEGIINWNEFISILFDLDIRKPLIFEVSDKEGALMSREYLETIISEKVQPEIIEEQE